MPLVDFNPTDIVKGYINDIQKFNDEQSSNKTKKLVIQENTDNQNDIAIPSLISGNNETDITKNIEKIIDAMKTIIRDMKDKLELKEYDNDGGWQNFEYSRDVPVIIKKDTNLANKLWGLRYAFCYQLLIYTYYKSITTEFSENEIKKFKLGIFGSLTPTSDIDIGFQYSEINNRKVGIIAHVVEIFEDSFLDLTSKYSLGYDIEPYADMMYLDNEQGGIFYCDTTDFEIGDVIQMMPEIGASIIRNTIQSQIDIRPDIKDIRRYKIQEEATDSINMITGLIDGFKFSDITIFFNKLIGEERLQNFKLKNEINFESESIKKISSILNDNTNGWIEEAKKLAKEYMTKIYNESRKQYYEKVKAAEEILLEIGLTREAVIDKNNRIRLMKAISNALIFRAESYVSPSTVMHIVRVMQGKETLDGNCESVEPKKSKAQCALGEMGYLMSCLEQIGYLYRFDKTYCEENNHKDEYKCDKKYKKYMERLVDGMYHLQKPTAGGKRRRRYSKKQLNKLKTRKYNKMSNKRVSCVLYKKSRKQLKISKS